VQTFLQEAFYRVVPQHFGPLATRRGLELSNEGDFFQIAGNGFCLRVRLGPGHRTNVLVTVVPFSGAKLPFGSPGGEIGLGVIMEFYGDRLVDVPSIQDEVAMQREIERLARLADKFCGHFLLDRSAEWSRVQDFVENKIRSEARSTTSNFPPNVREEW
jgi:hypothetical protein